MSVRTVGEDVKAILDTSLTAEQVESYIQAASLIVDEQLVGESLSDALLTEIEKWLAAHLVASTRDMRVQKESADGISLTYQGKTGLGLDATFYGQTTKRLDPTGKLGALDQPNRRSYVFRIGNEIDVEVDS